MSDVLFAVCGGVAFILLGRWMYNNPARVYPGWVSSDANSQLHPRFIKGFATVVIFVGSYAVIAGITERFLSPWLAISVAILAGIAGALLLRPSVSAPGQ